MIWDLVEKTLLQLKKFCRKKTNLFSFLVCKKKKKRIEKIEKLAFQRIFLTEEMFLKIISGIKTLFVF